MITDNNNYKLGVIIPNWNGEKYVGYMLESILSQSFHDWQLFVVDDQSTDGSVDIIKDYEKRDKRVHLYIRNRMPKGAQTCRNIGFELTEGAEFVIWFDNDDLISPYCFQQRVNYLENHPELDFGVFPAKSFFLEKWDRGWDYYYGFSISGDTLQDMLNGTLTMVGWTNIYRRYAILRYHSIWDEKIMSMQDSDWNIQNLIKGMQFDYALKEGAKIDYFYRVNHSENAISNKLHTEEHYESHLYYLRKMDESFPTAKKSFYYNSLELFHVKCALILKNNKDYFEKFSHLPWIMNHPWFRLRLCLWKIFGFRLTYRLFFVEAGRLAKDTSTNAKIQRGKWLKAYVKDKHIR